MNDQTNGNSKSLEAKLKELQVELQERERDIAKYRSELSKANHRLENLIGQLQSELRTVQAVQKALVPTEFPNISGFEFSTKFIPSLISGGDYFDIFSHEDRLRFGLVMASCSGHATSALLLSVLLKLTGRMEARKGAEPDKVVSEILNELTPHLEGANTAELFYALVDRRSYEMSFCRLGDLVALHQSFPSGELKILESSGPAITAQSSSRVQIQSLTLNPRDKLILCTKGITETANLEGEAYGLPRLSQSLTEGLKKGVHEVRNQVLYDLQKYAHGTEPQRDQTILVLEVKDRVIKLAKI